MSNCVRSFHTRAIVNSIAITSDGCFAAFGERDGSVEVYNVRSGLTIMSLEDTGISDVYTVAFSSDGRLLAAAGMSGAVGVWDARSGHCICSFGEHEWCVTDLAFSRDGNCVASASLDHTIRIWSAHTGEVRQVYEHEWEVTSIDWSHNGAWIASGDYLGNIRVWQTATGRTLSEYMGHVSTQALGPGAEGISDLTFSHDDLLIASSQVCREGEPGQLLIWEVASGYTRISYQDTARHSDFIHNGLNWQFDGKLCGAMLDGSIHLLPSNASSEVQVHSVPAMGYAARMQTDGKSLLTSDSDSALVHLWTL